MIPMEEALKLIDEHVISLPPTTLSLHDAINHYLARDITAPLNVAPFRNSAMDGFAVCADQIRSAPVTLEIADTVFAGDNVPKHVDQKKAIKVMTGAPVPDLYDSVVRFEDTDFVDNKVTINIPVKRGQNLRLAGEDVAINDCILRQGQLLQPMYSGILASVGLNSIEVIRKPSLLVVSTGNELVPQDQELQFGQIYDSNSYTIEALVARFASTIEKRTAVADDRDSLRAILNTKHDVIVTSGGVSAGEKDYLPEVAKECGWTPLFHKIRIKPGKPIFVAIRGKQVFFGLPGNPLSTAVTGATLLLPALKKMCGARDYIPELSDATLDESSPMKSGRTVIWPGKIEIRDGQVVATISAKRSSAALSALLDSDGLIFLFRDKPDDTPIIKVLPWHLILHT